MQKKFSILGGRSPPIKAKPDGLDPPEGNALFPYEHILKKNLLFPYFFGYVVCFHRFLSCCFAFGFGNHIKQLVKQIVINR